MTYLREVFPKTVPSSVSNGTPFKAYACHTTEGGVGRSGAYGTAEYLVSVAATRNASYHEMPWWNESSKTGGVLILLPPTRAAHSIAPQPFSASGLPLYQPDEWVRDCLGNTWWNPNQSVYALSIAGRTTDVARWCNDPLFLAFMRERFADLEKGFKIGLRAEHFRFNPRTRTDWGKILMQLLGGLEINEMAFSFADTLEPFAYGVIRANVEVYVTPSFGAAHNSTGEVARRVKILIPVRGAVYSIGGGKTSDRWVAFENNNVVKYVPAIYVEIESDDDSIRIRAKDGAFDSIVATAEQGKAI
jgi:hypothetical protein